VIVYDHLSSGPEEDKVRQLGCLRLSHTLHLHRRWRLLALRASWWLVHVVIIIINIVYVLLATTSARRPRA
jgi:hypothetical protein